MIQSLRLTLPAPLRLRYPYPSLSDRRRATGLLYLAGLMLVVSLVNAFLAYLLPLLTGAEVAFDWFQYLVGPLMLAAIIIMVQTGRLQIASSIVVGVLLLAAVLSTIEGDFTPQSFTIGFLPLAAAAVLLPRAGLVVVYLILVINILITSLLQYMALTDDAVSGPLIIMTLVTAVFLAVSQDAYQVARQAERDLEQFEHASRFNAQTTDLDEYRLFREALRFMRDQLQYGYAQIFLADEHGDLNRRLHPGLSADDDAVPVSLGTASGLLEAQRIREPVIVSQEDNPLRRGHLFPNIVHALAVPILDGDQVIGVLDAQSSTESFTPARIETLQVLAEQIALSLRHSRTINALRSDLAQQEETINYLRAQVQEFRGAARQSIGRAWDTYLETRGWQAIGFDLRQDDRRIIPAHDLPTELRSVFRRGEIEVIRDDEQQQIIVPVWLRDEVLGAMAFSVPAGRAITDQQLEMAQNIGNRLALALENQRLFEQSQTQALRERKASEISGLLIGATDLDQVLALAAESFNEALGAVRTRIHLHTEALSDPAPPAANGQPESDAGGDEQ
jgi:GAF domain-containing protein